MKRIILFLFILAAALNVLSQVMIIPTLEIVTKPLLVLLVTGYYWQAVMPARPVALVLLALLFSWGGDVLLMFQARNELFFVFGLASFLIAHLFYIAAYQRLQTEDATGALTGVQRFRFSLPIILAGTGLITVLYNHLGDLKVPVIVYAVVLMLMVINALFRFGRTTSGSFLLVFFGAILFMISDALIAINKFLVHVSQSGFWIMTTYISAQFLIVVGIVRHQLAHRE